MSKPKTEKVSSPIVAYGLTQDQIDAVDLAHAKSLYRRSKTTIEDRIKQRVESLKVSGSIEVITQSIINRLQREQVERAMLQAQAQAEVKKAVG